MYPSFFSRFDWAVSAGFFWGAACSLLAGYLGMRIAVLANARTTFAATVSRSKALRVAFNAGAITGMLVAGLALLSVGLFFLLISHLLGPKPAVDSLIGLALGSSLISVFARLGGGNYAKAADAGADLVGKFESNLGKMILEIPTPSRTTWATTWVTARVWQRIFLKPMWSV